MGPLNALGPIARGWTHVVLSTYHTLLSPCPTEKHCRRVKISPARLTLNWLTAMWFMHKKRITGPLRMAMGACVVARREATPILKYGLRYFMSVRMECQSSTQGM